jgi:predicted LPLAT superfamily acyltransferase
MVSVFILLFFSMVLVVVCATLCRRQHWLLVVYETGRNLRAMCLLDELIQRYLFLLDKYGSRGDWSLFSYFDFSFWFLVFVSGVAPST